MKLGEQGGFVPFESASIEVGEVVRLNSDSQDAVNTVNSEVRAFIYLLAAVGSEPNSSRPKSNFAGYPTEVPSFIQSDSDLFSLEIRYQENVLATYQTCYIDPRLVSPGFESPHAYFYENKDSLEYGGKKQLDIDIDLIGVERRRIVCDENTCRDLK